MEGMSRIDDYYMPPLIAENVDTDGMFELIAGIFNLAWADIFKVVKKKYKGEHIINATQNDYDSAVRFLKEHKVTDNVIRERKKEYLKNLIEEEKKKKEEEAKKSKKEA